MPSLLRALGVLLLGLAICAPRGARRAAPCVSPIAEREWQPFIHTQVDSDSWTARSAAPRLEDVRVEQLVGEWELTVVATRSPRVDTLTTGTLTLGPAEFGAELFPLSGWSDVDLERVGYVTLAHSPAQRDPRHPGVQVSSRDGRVSLRFGNSLHIQADGWLVKTTDSGVFFDLFAADGDWMTGWWYDGGRSSARSQGYFCVRRIGE